MLTGKKLLLNEVNIIPQDLLSVFTQALDARQVVLSGSEWGNVTVPVHPQFGVIATANPNYTGTLEIGVTWERRFGHGTGNVAMDFLPPAEEAEAVFHELQRVAVLAHVDAMPPQEACAAVAAAAAELRSHPEVGGIMRDRRIHPFASALAQRVQLNRFQLGRGSARCHPDAGAAGSAAGGC